MNDQQKTRAFNAQRTEQLKQSVAIQKDTHAEIVRLLKQARADINTTLSNSPSEWESWYLPQLQQSIDNTLTEFGQQAAGKIAQGADQAFEAGQALMDKPLEAAQFNIVGRLPQLDKKQLLAMKYFMTDRIKDIGTQLTNKINSELGLVAIGAQSPSGAKQTIGRYFAKDGERRALTIVRTELGRVYSIAAQQRMEQAREVLPGLKKQWRRSGKLHSRLSHDAADGQIRDIKEKFLIGTVHMMYPRDPKAPIGETVNCGCKSLPYMANWKMKNPGKKPFTQAEIDGSANKRLLSGADKPENLVVSAATRYWMANKVQTKWHNSSFAKAPENLQQVIRKHDSQLNNVTYHRDELVSYRPGSNEINLHSRETSRKNIGTWQHEYGHFLDEQIGRQSAPGIARSVQPDFIEALNQDKKTFLNASGMGRRSKKQREILAKNAILNEEVTATLSKLDVDKRKKWLDKTSAALGLKRRDVFAVMKSDGYYDQAKEARDLRAAYLLESIKRQDVRTFLYYFNGKDQGEWQSSKVYDKGIAGKFSDLIGSITKNKLGGHGLYGLGGHGDDYYRAIPNRHAKEVFANLTTLNAQNHPFWNAVLKAFTPQLNALYNEVLNNE